MKPKVDQLSSRVRQIEDLFRVPSVIGHFASAKSLAMSIARQAPSDDVAHLAMQLATEVDALKESELPLGAGNVHLNKILWKLRLALEEAGKSFKD